MVSKEWRDYLHAILLYGEDWIKTEQNREEERQIHDRLAKEHDAD